MNRSLSEREGIFLAKPQQIRYVTATTEFSERGHKKDHELSEIIHRRSKES